MVQYLMLQSDPDIHRRDRQALSSGQSHWIVKIDIYRQYHLFCLVGISLKTRGPRLSTKRMILFFLPEPADHIIARCHEHRTAMEMDHFSFQHQLTTPENACFLKLQNKLFQKVVSGPKMS